MSGKLIYWVPEGNNRHRSLRLTVCSDEDNVVGGLADLRRKRLSRILSEAMEQGAMLRYRDLCMIMLTSKATIKRDVSHLRQQGVEIMFGKGGSLQA